jgi:colicin import membrane protein
VAEVREASATLSALAAAVLAGQGRPTAPARAAVSTRLAEIAAEPSLTAQLASGRLGAGAVETEGVFELGAEDGAVAASAKRKTPARAGRDKPGVTAERAPTDRADRAAAKKHAAAEAKRERERAKAIEKAERAGASAQTALTTATEALQQAEAQVAEAHKQLDRAEREREKAAAERDRRRDAALKAAEALEYAQQL